MTDDLGLFEAEQLAEANTTSWRIPLGWKADNVGECRSCHQPVMWAITPKGNRAPLNPDGTSHFANCPQARDWRKRA